jgi:hypothetical protein
MNPKVVQLATKFAGIDKNGHPLANSLTEADHFKNDIGYGDAFVRHHAESIRFCPDEKLWFIFNETDGWRRDDIGQIRALAADYARERYRGALTSVLDMDPDSGKRIIASMRPSRNLPLAATVAFSPFAKAPSKHSPPTGNKRMTTLDQYSIPEAEFQKLRQRANSEGVSLSDLQKQWWQDKVVADVFEDDSKALDKQRSQIAKLQSQLDQNEALARDRASAYASAVNRRDALTANVTLVKERLARLAIYIAEQPFLIENIVIDKGRSDDDVRASIGALNDMRLAVPHLEAILDAQQNLLGP